MSALRVFARPIGLHSHAMVRIANAIEAHAPASVEFVEDQSAADLIIFYPIGADWMPAIENVEALGKQYALVQCCVKSTGASCSTWWPVWQRSACTWSYLDVNRILAEEIYSATYSEGFTIIPRLSDSRFYYAPLGVDDALRPALGAPLNFFRKGTKSVVTTGHVSGCPAEAIYEVWEAALASGYTVTHVGPKLPEWRPGVRVRTGISDRELRAIYNSATFVASLRYVEGFELPAAEGLVNGATPILFDQPDLRHWYGNSAMYVPECEGPELVRSIKDVFEFGLSVAGNKIVGTPVLQPVHDTLRSIDILSRFSWPPLVEEFWHRILSNI